MIVRHATPDDHAAIRRINTAAFPAPAEACLVDALRADGDLLIEMVAERNSLPVGCIQFSRLLLTGAPDVQAAALAPMAVLPEAQNRGLGSALVRSGIEACRHLDLGAVIVLGHPDYYPRFGFSHEAALHVRDPFGAGTAFMALSLRPGALDHPLSPRYARAFRI